MQNSKLTIITKIKITIIIIRLITLKMIDNLIIIIMKL